MPSRARLAIHGGVLALALTGSAACEGGPTGSRPPEALLAASGAVPGHPDEWFGLYVLSADGSNPRRLTSGIPVHEPEWSPDGRRIAFFGSADAAATRGIYVVGGDGTQLQRITQGADAYPAWSPDGQWLAFGGHGQGAGIYVVRPDGTEMRRILACASHCSRPSWSPDGGHIAYVGWTPGPHVYVMRSDGSQPVRLSEELAYSTDPDWSPEGGRLVVVGRAVGAGDEEPHLFLVAVADGSATRVTSTPAAYRSPAFSGDGSRIAFSLFADVDGRMLSQLHVIGRNGQGPAQVTFPPGTFAEPSWQP